MGLMVTMLGYDTVSIIETIKKGGKNWKNYACHIFTELVSIGIGVFWYTH